MKQHKGGGIDTEHIEICWLPLKESKKFVLDTEQNIPPGLQFALFWFYDQYPHLCKDIE